MRGLIDQLVAFHVLSQEAHARKLDATDTDVQARMGQFKGGFPDEQAFQKALTAQGMTLDQLQKQTRMGLDVSKVLDAEVNSKIAVQDADVDTFYKENTERFKQGETVHASHILIGVPQGADAATKQAARVKAQQVLKQVKAGGDFDALAESQVTGWQRANTAATSGSFQRARSIRRSKLTSSRSNRADERHRRDAVRLSHHKGRRAAAARTAPLTEVAPTSRNF